MPKGSKLRTNYDNEKYIEVFWLEGEMEPTNEYEADYIRWFWETWKEEHDEDELPLNEKESCRGFLGSEIRRNTITKVTFTDDMSMVPAHAWDVSEEQDQSVMAWTEHISAEGLTEVVIAGQGGVWVDDSNSSRWLFLQCTRLQEIHFNGCLDTSQMTSMWGLFRNCGQLVKVDVSSLNTSHVTDMGYMFEKCKSLKEIDLSGMDLSHVTDMGHMFCDCASLEQISFQGLDTSQVTDMQGLFTNCENLVSVDMSGLDTSKVTDMAGMFNSCRSLEKIDMTGWDTRNVVHFRTMFYGCWNLKALDVTHFDTRNATSMNYMFSACRGLEEIDVSHFDTRSVEYLSGMFMDCTGLKKISLQNFDTSNVKLMKSLFEGCTSLEWVDVSSFDTVNVRDMRQIFYECSSLCELDVSHFDMTKALDRRMVIKGDSAMFRYVECPIKKPDPYGCLVGKRIPFGTSLFTGKPFYWIVEKGTEYEFFLRLDGALDPAEWEKLVTDDMKKHTENWLSCIFKERSFSEEEEECVTFFELDELPDSSKVQPRFDVPLWCMEEIYGYLRLAIWLSLEFDESALPSLDGKAKHFYSPETSELEKERFFEALEMANLETKRKFYVPLSELLKMMAEHDDARSIERIAGLCTELHISYDGKNLELDEV